MNPKLILAESLEVLKKAEAQEIECDRLQEAISKSSRLRKELNRLKRSYSSVYDLFIRGLEMMNFVRRTAIGVGETDLVSFCEQRMTYFMDRCEALRSKEANILLPLSQMDAEVKTGFTTGEIVATLLPNTGLTKKIPWRQTVRVHDGSYLLTTKNVDLYGVAAPLVVVEVVVKGEQKRQNLKKTIPCQCGWSRMIGIVGEGEVTITVTSDAVVRESHVDLQCVRLEATSPGTSEWMQSLPKLDGLSVIESSETVPKPPVKIEVQPQLPLSSRMELIRRQLDVWPAASVNTTPLRKEDQFVLQAIHQLPIPTDICADVHTIECDFSVKPNEIDFRHYFNSTIYFVLS